MKTMWVVLLIAFLAYACQADVVHLKGGKKFEGRVHDKGDSIQVEMVRGKILIPKSMVERVEEKPYILTDYDRQALLTPTDDLDGQLKLARWCVENGLRTRARKHYAAALALDPENKEALNYFAGTGGKAASSQQELDVDEAYLQKFRAINQQSARDQYRLGMWCRAHRREELARKHLARAIALNPQYKEAIEALKEGDLSPPLAQEPPPAVVTDGDNTKPKAPTEPAEADSIWGKHGKNVTIENNLITMSIGETVGKDLAYLCFREPFKNFTLTGELQIEEFDRDFQFFVRFKSTFQEGSSAGHDDDYCAWRYFAGQHTIVYCERKGASATVAQHELTLPQRKWIRFELVVKDGAAEVSVGKMRILKGTLPPYICQGSGVYFVIVKIGAEAKIKLTNIKINRL